MIRVVGASSGKQQAQHQSGTDEEVFVVTPRALG